MTPRRWPGRLLVLSLSTVLLAAAAPSQLLAQDASPAPDPEATAQDESAVATPLPESEPASIRTDRFAGGFDAPVYLADDGVPGKTCLYVVERGGTIRIIEPDGFVRERPFLDISDRVKVGAQQGLHGIAFHPGFRKNGRFFVHYNSLPDGDSVIAEFRGRPCKRANQKPVKPSVLTVEQPFANNNAGWIGFGPDGYLYIPLGDGGGAAPGDPLGYGQLESPRLAKVLRINVDKGKLFAIPKDNPYAKKPKGFPRETWARGLRDPRRASFDRETGDLWIGDAGQLIEEVNRIPAGQGDLNFGWSVVAGAESCGPAADDCDASGYEPPVFEYAGAPPQLDITGGYVYRGEAIPDLRGTYLFSDFASGTVWGIDAAAAAAGFPAEAEVLLESPQGFISFGEDDAGELYLVSLDGTVFRINPEER